MRVFILHLEIS